MKLSNYIEQTYINLESTKDRLNKFSLDFNFTVTKAKELYESTAIIYNGVVYEASHSGQR